MPSLNHIESDRSALGLVAWLESTRVRLPLKGVECRFDVTAGIASVELDQIFYQDNAQALDCTYSFPLPAGAAVYRCEMHINGRVIRARVEEQAAARQMYAERKAAGQRAALVETERENLFTLSLGNVQPRDLVVIRFAFFQNLERLNGEVSLRVPLCPGVRYIPGKTLLRSPSGKGIIDDTDQTPDASRISPPRIDSLHPDAAYFNLRGRIAASDAESGSIASPSHPLISRLHAGGFEVELASIDAVPDRDLVIRWREPAELALKPRAWRVSREGETFALVELRAPIDLPTSVEAEGQDFYFLVDRSGSMEGAKWQTTCQGLNAFVGLLGLQDRVNVTLFEDTHADFAEGPLPALTLIKDPRFRGLASVPTGGGANLLPALTHVLRLLARHTTPVKRSARIVLITDGQVGNEAAIIEIMQRQAGLPMYVLGIDTAVNDAFLKSLGRVTGGGCTLITPGDDILGTVKGLGARLRQPVLTHVLPEGQWEPATDLPINLHAGDTVTMSFRSCAESTAPIVLRGKRADGTEQRFELVPEAVAHAEAIPLLWAREKITAALDRSDSVTAIGLARRYTLLCKGAAFVAWDELERVPVAKQEMYQPSQEPLFAASALAAPALMSHGKAARYGAAQRVGGQSFDEASASEFEVLDRLKKSAHSSPGSAPRKSAKENPASDAAEWGEILARFKCPALPMSQLMDWYASADSTLQAHLLKVVLIPTKPLTSAQETDFSLAELARRITNAVEEFLAPGPKRNALVTRLKEIFKLAAAGSPST